MQSLIDWLRHLAALAEHDYHVSAPILVTIYLVSIPVFWVALALAVKEAVRLRRQALPYRGQRLSLSLLVLALRGYLPTSTWLSKGATSRGLSGYFSQPWCS